MMTMSFGNGSSNGSSLGALNGTSAVWAGLGSLPLDGTLEPLNEAYPLIVRSPGFPDQWWDPALRAQLILADFATKDWRSAKLIPPDDSAVNLQTQVSALLKLRTLRQRRLPEILAQADGFVGYWLQLLGAEAGLRPHSTAVVHAGVVIGQMVGMHWKAEHKRIRPSHLYPALVPVVPVPRHPSYPSNHAFQSRLIALSLDAALPEALRLALGKDGLLGDLALRIGENREVAGVHFPDDSQAGRSLAELVFPLMSEVPSFQTLLGQAATEWLDCGLIGKPIFPVAADGA